MNAPAPGLLAWGLVALGGALGALARFALSLWLNGPAGRWPWGTFLVNIVGAFALGVIGGLLAQRPLSPATASLLRYGLGAGFLGALTTFSAFEWELHQQAAARHHLLLATYLGLSVGLGFLAVRLGAQTGAALGNT